MTMSFAFHIVVFVYKILLFMASKQGLIGDYPQTHVVNFCEWDTNETCFGGSGSPLYIYFKITVNPNNYD